MSSRVACTSLHSFAGLLRSGFRSVGLLRIPLLLALVLCSFLWAESAISVEPNAGTDGIEFVSHNEQNPFHCMDVEIVGDRAYVANGMSNGIETYDISDPAEIHRLDAVGPTTWRLRAYGHTLYAFCHQYGMRILDISGATLDLGGYSGGEGVYYEGGTLVGDHLYVAAHDHGIHVLDVAEPDNVSPVSAFSLGDDAAWAVEHIGDHLLVANGRHGLVVVDISGIPTVTANLPLDGLANDLQIDDSGTVAVVSLGLGGLATIDVSNPDDPALLDIAETAGACFGMGRMGTLVAVGSVTRLELFDISDPSRIELAGFDYTLAWAMGADIEDDAEGGLIMVADWVGISAYRPRTSMAADIEIQPARVDFGRVVSTADTVVTVHNRGNSLLDVSLVAPDGFSVESPSFILGAGERLDLRVTATGPDPTGGSLSLASNDPDEPLVSLFVYKNNTTFAQIGSEGADFALTGTDGELHTLSEHRGEVVLLEFGSFL